MSLSATCSDVAIPKSGLETRTLLIIIWLATVMMQLLTGFVRCARAMRRSPPRWRCAGSWTARGPRQRRWPALAFAATTLGLFAATVPPAGYGVAACDALSIVHVVAAGIGGVGLAILAAAPALASPWRRLAGAGALAAVSPLRSTWPSRPASATHSPNSTRGSARCGWPT
jgi:hypothetical protein